MNFNKADLELIDKEFEGLRLASLRRCATQKEYEIVLKAFEFANKAHYNVRRRSGEPYILHPIAVAKIVINDIGLGYKSIVSALLHDVVEDTEYTIEDVERLFGPKISSLVDGLTKIKAAMNTHESSLQAENFKRIILTLNDDVRVVLIKLADRLHNIRTIEYMPEYKRDKILSETMFIFIPLAHRLGLYNIKSEMENIWLKNREPEAYNEIQNNLDALIIDKEADIDEFMKPIADYLNNSGIKFKIFRRTKSPYSIWQKMHKKNIPFDEIYDIFAVRIIFTPDKDERAECYQLYVKISSMYTAKIERLRDWISNPKPNGYEALHCTVMSKKGNWIEVQIRTDRMNDIAEKGIAAHWNYKRKNPNLKENQLDIWLDKVKETLANPDIDAIDFLDNFHNDVISANIYVFTHKGESKLMPKGSTVLDFAYSIHSEIGNNAIAAKVNLKLVPLSTVLRNGDQIEIITAKTQKPKAEWLKFLTTSRAKNYVYSAIKENRQSTDAALGKEMLENELKKYNLKLTDKITKKLLNGYQVHKENELYDKISVRMLNLENVVKILKKEKHNSMFWTLQFLNPMNIARSKNSNNENTINPIQPNKDYLLKENPENHTLSYRIADCCYPIPGDKIVAFVSDNGEVIIHKKTCSVANELASIQGERIINAKWAKHTMQSFPARIKLSGVDKLGILHNITRVMTTTLNINMKKVVFESSDEIFEGYLDCYVHNTNDLDDLIKHLRKITGVTSVTRAEITNKL